MFKSEYPLCLFERLYLPYTLYYLCPQHRHTIFARFDTASKHGPFQCAYSGDIGGCLLVHEWKPYPTGVKERALIEGRHRHINPSRNCFLVCKNKICPLTMGLHSGSAAARSQPGRQPFVFSRARRRCAADAAASLLSLSLPQPKKSPSPLTPSLLCSQYSPEKKTTTTTLSGRQALQNVPRRHGRRREPRRIRQGVHRRQVQRPAQRLRCRRRQLLLQPRHRVLRVRQKT